MKRYFLKSYITRFNKGLFCCAKKSHKGSALIIALMVLLVFSILSAALLNMAFFEGKSSIRAEQYKQAYYLARSGQEIMLSLLNKNKEELNHLPVYIYGSIEEGFAYSRGSYSNNHNDESIVAVAVGANGEGIIISYGNVDGAIERIELTFHYGSELEQGTPPSPPAGGVSAGSDDEGEGALNWYNSNNGKIKQGTGSYEGDVTFRNSSNKAVITLENNRSTLIADSMYFDDAPVSLVVTTNSTLTLFADLISFRGVIDIDEHSLEDHNGRLILNTNNSKIMGQEIGGHTDVNYGIVFLGSGVRLNGAPFSGIVPNCFYYFPENVNLNSQQGINELIKIEDLGSIDFDKLGLGIGSGGIDPGLYR